MGIIIRISIGATPGIHQQNLPTVIFSVMETITGTVVMTDLQEPIILKAHHHRGAILLLHPEAVAAAATVEAGVHRVAAAVQAVVEAVAVNK